MDSRATLLMFVCPLISHYASHLPLWRRVGLLSGPTVHSLILWHGAVAIIGGGMGVIIFRDLIFNY